MIFKDTSSTNILWIDLVGGCGKELKFMDPGSSVHFFIFLSGRDMFLSHSAPKWLGQQPFLMPLLIQPCAMGLTPSFHCQEGGDQLALGSNFPSHFLSQTSS